MISYLLQYRAVHKDLVYFNFKRIHKSLLSWLHPGNVMKYWVGQSISLLVDIWWNPSWVPHLGRRFAEGSTVMLISCVGMDAWTARQQRASVCNRLRQPWGGCPTHQTTASILSYQTTCNLISSLSTSKMHAKASSRRSLKRDIQWPPNHPGVKNLKHFWNANRPWQHGLWNPA